MEIKWKPNLLDETTSSVYGHSLTLTCIWYSENPEFWIFRNKEDNLDVTEHWLTTANSLYNNLQLWAVGVLSALGANLDPTEQYSNVQCVYCT